MNKDAADLYKILTTFDSAGNQHRLFDQEIELLEAVGHDLTLAGAQVLGRDAARIAESDMLKAASYEVNVSFVARLFERFRRAVQRRGKPM